jgi:hypothetical protein
MGEKWPVNLACDSDFHVNHRVLLHDANLRHGTDGFTFPLKEGMLWIFSPEKSDGFSRDRTQHQAPRFSHTIAASTVGCNAVRHPHILSTADATGSSYQRISLTQLLELI